MYKTIVYFILLSSSLYALSTHQEENNLTVNIKSIRGLMGTNNPIKHSSGQIRAGFIRFSENDSSPNNAYALGGHYHLDTKRWNGIEFGISVYTVLNLTTHQNTSYINPDFFDRNNHSFIQVTEAYIDGTWLNTTLKLGRQILNTPHTDSDDIRMIPNYFEAYTFKNSDIKNLTFELGYIRKMAGWENGVNPASFVNIGQSFGTNDIDGLYYASTTYNGIKDMSLSLWFYHIIDIANIWYGEIAYELHPLDFLDTTFGIQYDISEQTNIALLGKQDAKTIGISAEFASEILGIHLFTAYNKDFGRTGASSLNLGGGALFTSMENQTLDALGEAGEAWVLGLGYHFSAIGIDGLNADIAYGHFASTKTSNNKVNELNFIVEYTLNENFSLLGAYASTKFKNSQTPKNTQFRIISNYNF